MPNTASAKKALRRNKRQAKHNATRRDAYKSAVKAYKKFVAAKQFDDAAKMLVHAYRALDKAAKSKTIKKNKASRLKSRLAALLKESK
ncbi:MAG: 30S ribosomal protein S20 [bacterium]|nr:30S ribosomal protein S20 [bacterium]